MFSRKKDTPKTEASPVVEVERRAAIRYPSEEEASCAMGRLAARAWGKVRDISVLGVGLAIDREIKAGTRLMVEIATKKPSIALRALARVVHCRQQSDMTWVIGCQFDTPLRDEDVQNLAVDQPASE
jgi:hypothetical protein